MLHYVTGNLLESSADALVNTVNTVGVMGKGIALQFKEAFPANYKLYKDVCKAGELTPGKLLLVREGHTRLGEKIIINFPTKQHWRNPSEYSYIESGLKELALLIDREHIQSIAVPPLGCGNGGLEWPIVKGMIEHHLSGLNAEIYIYEPNAGVKAVLQKENTGKAVALTPARAQLLYLLFYYERTGEYSSLFSANKLAYFLQRMGEKMKLAFVPYHYGPYAQQIAHVLYALNGVYLKGFEQMDAKAFEPLQLNYDRFPEVKQYIEQHLDGKQKQRLDAMMQLIDGFQSELSLEVLASVDYAVAQYPDFSPAQVYEYICNWNERKSKLIKKEYVDIAYVHLKKYSDSFLLSNTPN